MLLGRPLGKLHERERLFVTSLKRHGYRFTPNKRAHFKKRKGYIVSSDQKEDAGGIDFWVKPPGDDNFYPVQVTQRGNKLQAQHSLETSTPEDFDDVCNERPRAKRKFCKDANIPFVLLRDCAGKGYDTNLAWGDVRALRNALS